LDEIGGANHQQHQHRPAVSEKHSPCQLTSSGGFQKLVTDDQLQRKGALTMTDLMTDLSELTLESMAFEALCEETPVAVVVESARLVYGIETTADEIARIQRAFTEPNGADGYTLSPFWSLWLSSRESATTQE
jgi:hypothetical protein